MIARVALVAALFLLVPATSQAEGITLILNGSNQGTFTCAGSGGCFGNDITLNVNGAGTDWTVTLTINTSGNTNSGDGIAAVEFKLNGFTFSGVTGLATTAGGTWTAASGPSAAGGCNGVNNTFICAQQASFLGGGAPGAPLDGSTWSWTWTIAGQTFQNFDSLHIGVVFGELATSGCGSNPTPCFKSTGNISATTGELIPEPGTMALFGTGLLSLAGAIRRRLAK
jgi:hypothetical protein